MYRIFLAISFFCLVSISCFGQTASNQIDSTKNNKPGQQSIVTMITIDGSISPPTTNYIKRGLKAAKESNSEILLVQLDTPGGLLESTKNIVQLFLDSTDMPIVVYVTPSGGRAASAGTYITMASHIAVMAPTTTIGAASPVQSGGGQTDSVMQKKIFNYSENFIESIAKRRNRNAEWAKSAVRDGQAVTAKEAVELNVVNFIAQNRKGLLNRIDGKVINEDTLHTRDATIRPVKTNLAETFFAFIMRPEITLILTMIAIYGIVGEVTNPGAVVPGMAGAVALVLVLYASAAMPINIAGFILIGLAIVLFIVEAFTPTFGLLIGGGAVSFFLGALMLFQDLPESMSISWAWILPATIITTLFFIWIATEGIRVQFTSSKTGKESMVGKTAEVVDEVTASGGRVFVNGEYWNAMGTDQIAENKRCVVKSVEGLKLMVEPKANNEKLDSN